MVSLAARLCLALAIVAVACQRKPLTSAEGAGGSGHVGGAPDSGQIGGAGNDAGGAAGVDGPAGPTNDAGGAGGDGRADQEHPDGATRESILAPLATTDTTIDQATGAELFNLAKAIGYARGYALCTCLVGFQLSAEDIDGCSQEEAGFRALFPPAQGRCIFDLSREVPGFDEYVRCLAKLIRESARDYVECARGTGTVPAPIPVFCDASETVRSLLAGAGCERAFACADGTLTIKGRCDFIPDCSNSDDERGCGHFICGDKLVDPERACIPQHCPVTFTPPLCLPNNPLLFLCGDGTATPTGDVCDGVTNCADGRDESYCF